MDSDRWGIDQKIVEEQHAAKPPLGLTRPLGEPVVVGRRLPAAHRQGRYFLSPFDAEGVGLWPGAADDAT